MDSVDCPDLNELKKMTFNSAVTFSQRVAFKEVIFEMKIKRGFVTMTIL